MKKLTKYLKPYALTIIFCFAMLVGQAACELNLPNFMSDIVNVGIQQKGVDHAAPEAISEDGFSLMLLFMDAAQKSQVTQNYTLLKSSEQQASAYAKKYPLLQQENIYVLKEHPDVPRSELDRAFQGSAMTLVTVFKNFAQSETINAQALSGMNFQRMYDLIPAFESMPEEMLAAARDKALLVDESIAQQIAVVFAQRFYQEVGVSVADMQSAYILRIGLYMIILTLLSAVATVIVSFLSARISSGVCKVLRRDVFKKIEGFSNPEFDKFSTSSLITRTTNDITQIQTLIMMAIRMICYAPIIALGGIVMALGRSVSLSWVIALGVVVLIGLILVIYALAMPKFKVMQKLVDRLNLIVREHLSGIMVIRAFGTQNFEEKRFAAANGELTGVSTFVNRLMAFMMPAMMFIMNTISLLVIWVGAGQIAASAMQVGDMMAFMQYAIQIIISFLMISVMFIMVPRAAVSAERIVEVLETEPSVQDKPTPKKLGRNIAGTVEFRNVSFRYEGAAEDVLSNISFTARPGETTAFIGSTGSGKSTLIHLIPRFYDVSDGQILIDGVDIRDISQHDLHELIGYVPQKGVLFSGDIASNLRYGDLEATDEKIKTAAKVAQAEEFISAKPKGYNDPIAQGGGNVSGGQKQRLSIARALVKDPKIYIFDDSFSALDFKTDALLRQALKEYTNAATILIVAQRIATIRSAEQIIVLDEGKMVGIGTHDELIKNCATYREIAASQLSKEEL